MRINYDSDSESWHLVHRGRVVAARHAFQTRDAILAWLSDRGLRVMESGTVCWAWGPQTEIQPLDLYGA